MVTIKENMGITARINNRNAYAPGLLAYEKGEWKLYEAARYLIPIESYGSGRNRSGSQPGFKIEKTASGKRYIKREIKGKNEQCFYYGDCVEFKVARNSERKIGKYIVWNGIVEEMYPLSEKEQSLQRKNAYVYIGEEFSRKRGESIFVKGNLKRERKEDIEHAFNGLKESLKVYRNEAINRNYPGQHSGYESFEDAEKKGVIPIWYKKEGSCLYFSAASIGRMQYKKNLVDLIGRKKPCKERKDLCKACRLFGMTAGVEAVGSRIRIEDAWCKQFSKNNIKKRVTLKELGSPRASYMPFYAEKRNGVCASYDEAGAGIKGRKFYWHNPAAREDSSVYTTKEKTERNGTYDLIMPGTEFEFKIYYDDITKEQLDELVWAVTFWENKEDGCMCHKLGHGKPLGLGSVKIVVTQKAERHSDGKGYQVEMVKGSDCVQEKEPVDEKNDIICEIKKISNFKAQQGKKICYPYIELDGQAEYDRNHRFSRYDLKENVLASHQWFTQNKGTRKDSPEACKIAPILEDAQELPVYFAGNLQRKDFK
jgi:CRISPR-associated protein (TIGR03986 family)